MPLDSYSESQPQPTLSTLTTHLLPSTTLTRAPLHPTNLSLTSTISSLRLHPTLEASLHILNADLPSAHFLVRHMSGPPAIEGMLLHSILHRTEGDFDNARAWASDVRDAVEGWVPKRKDEESLPSSVVRDLQSPVAHGESLLSFVYGCEGKEMGDLINDVERLRKLKRKEDEREEKEKEVEGRIRRELERTLDWCKGKFGDGEWADASEAWVRPSEEVQKMGEKMVSGEKGWRKF